MTQKVTEKITRERLRAMRDGDKITVECTDGYDLESKKSTAYSMKRLENRRFSCKSDGLMLTITCCGIN